MAVKPDIFTKKINVKYFQVMFRLMGYDIELKPSSPNKPEKIARIWGYIISVDADDGFIHKIMREINFFLKCCI
ncbi:MAG TPA: hypothetical protein VEF37_01700 [Thermodesulfovibrionales bacterium]|nr:hypothetical protein [Thermodesulfovibrionales bacterium]